MSYTLFEQDEDEDDDVPIDYDYGHYNMTSAKDQMELSELELPSKLVILAHRCPTEHGSARGDTQSKIFHNRKESYFQGYDPGVLKSPPSVPSQGF